MTDRNVTDADREAWEKLRDWPDGTTPREWTLPILAAHRQAAYDKGIEDAALRVIPAWGDAAATAIRALKEQGK